MKQLLPFLLVAALSAQELSLNQALLQAENGSADLQAIQQRLTSLDSTTQYYNSGANPELEVGTENLGIKEFEIVLSQELRFSAKKAPIQQQINLNKQELKLQASEIRRDLYCDVVDAYLSVSQLQEEAELIDSVNVSITQENQKIAHRIKMGAASKIELLEQQNLQIDLAEETLTIQSELRSSLAKLNSFFITGESKAVTKLKALSTEIIVNQQDEVPSSHPKLLALQIKTGEAELKRLESKALSIPVFAVNGGYKRENEVQENSLLLGFSLGLPFNKEADLASIEADIVMSTVKLQKVELNRLLSAELVNLSEQSFLAKERLRILREDRIPLAKEMVQTASLQYSRGVLSVADKIRYKRELISLQRQELTLIHAELLARSSQAIFTNSLKK